MLTGRIYPFLFIGTAGMNGINHTVSLVKISIVRLGLGLGLLLIAGCVTTPSEESGPSGPFFYPTLPDSPRIQYLATFSSSEDVSVPVTDFANFVLGNDQDNKIYRIQKPYGVDIYEGKIYAVDLRGGGYVVMDLVNLEFRLVTGDGGGRMGKPINITIDQDGTKYITDAKLNKVLVFDRDERFVQAFGIEGQFRPVDTAIFEDKLFVVDIKDHEIEVLNKRSGVLLYTIGRAGNLEGELYHPTNIKIGPDEHVYISETSNFRVSKFTLDGRYVRSFGTVGTNLGNFARPKGIALDKEGRLYIVDAAFENVQIMRPDGSLLLYFGSPGIDPDSINLPVDIEIDYDNAALFQQYAHPDFKLEYIILVTSQFGINKINVFGYGKMKGMEYPDDAELSNVKE